MSKPKITARFLLNLVASSALAVLWVSCQPYGRVVVTPGNERVTRQAPASSSGPAGLRPIPRYGGTVLTAKGMPRDATKAYYWAKNLGTLVAYETYLRRFPSGAHADWFRERIRERFVPTTEVWQEAWRAYSQLDVVLGAVCDPEEGLILLGKRGTGRLPPFLFDDVLTAIRCTLAQETIGVTMNRIFPARFKQPDIQGKRPRETSVEFYSEHSRNTHLGSILFEGDRMLKSLSIGYDLFLGEEVRSAVPGFATVVEMEVSQPMKSDEAREKDYGRAWIEVTTVKINTTETDHTAMFAEVHIEVKADSPNPPMIRFAKHIEDHYGEYARESVIFAEVERSARIVSLARWFVSKYPSAAAKLVSESYEEVRVETPQVIDAQFVETRGSRGLIGGVVLAPKNEYQTAPNLTLGNVRLADLLQKVVDARPNPRAIAWNVSLGPKPDDDMIALRVFHPPL